MPRFRHFPEVSQLFTRASQMKRQGYMRHLTMDQISKMANSSIDPDGTVNQVKLDLFRDIVMMEVIARFPHPDNVDYLEARAHPGTSELQDDIYYRNPQPSPNEKPANDSSCAIM